MRRLLGLALGILTAIGGFVDIGDLVTNGVVGSRFGLSLSWVVVLGVVGICLYSYMAGKVAAVSGRATFEIIRERLRARAGSANLVASLLINVMTVVAEIGGIALALELGSSISRFVWIPLAAFAVWLIIWRAKFSVLENIGGLMGLALIGFTVAVFLLHPGPSQWKTMLTHFGGSGSDNAFTYWYYAVAVFGAAMTPYEVLFFSSGGVEEGWTSKDLVQAKLNVFVGFPLGGILSLSIAAVAGIVLLPMGIDVTAVSDIALPVVTAGGRLLLAIVIIGIVGATLGAALETTLSTGYTLAQFFGWSWGKFRRPRQAARFHLSMLITLIVGIGVLMTGADPVMITELSVVFAAVALPLTYIPIRIVANDPLYMGEQVIGRITSALGTVFLVIVIAASVAASTTPDHHRSRIMTQDIAQASTQRRDRRFLDARLHLLGHQVRDRNRKPVCVIDDLEILLDESTNNSEGDARGDSGDDSRNDDVNVNNQTTPITGPGRLGALLDGRSLLIRVFGGRIPARQLRPIPWSSIHRINTTVDLNVDADEMEQTWAERWVRDRIIGRIPGATHPGQ